MTFIHIRGPILMVQGKNGQCGAMQQAEVVQQECYFRLCCRTRVRLCTAGHWK